jgi:hypothetical protein
MSCRKLAFDSIEQAERTAAVIAGLRPGEQRGPVRLYDCPRCGSLHFSSKGEAELRAVAPSTVADVGEIVPAFVAAAPTLPPAALCAWCNADGAMFEMRGALYHRRCRGYALQELPPGERRAELAARSREGQARAGAKRSGNGGGA